ncbi:MAG: Hint domain-containing protein, partial [Rhodobacteraceae bacterium]|nr:Hint domain-containing protein [Paracoccaceae bacterium]
ADFDTLIAQGLATIEWDGGDPSSESGTVTFYDSDLNPIGTVDYSEIERGLVLDVSGNTSLDASGTTAGVVDGTDHDDVIDVNYTDDPEGDMIDHNDALPPLQGNEDIVLAGAGDDVVMGGLASDVIFGESGNDTLFGEEGGDALGGGDGDDFLSGGEGSDIVAGGAGDDTISGDATVAGDSGDLLFGNEGDDSFVSIGQGDYIDGGEDADGQDVDVLDLSGAAEAANPGGTLSVDYDPANGENGTVTFYDADGNITGTAAFENIESVVCFTLGTLIATPKGERKIEDLKIGDRVITRDNGIQTIRWMGRKTLTGAHVKAARHLRPVLIQQGALGNGLPERDMMVSPNHRVLIANDKTALYFEEREVLVAAKHLTGLDGVDVVDVSNVTYIHFMFDQHEVVLSDGAWTESFQPGDHSLAGIGNAQRNEMFELFPELESTEGLQAYHSARRSLKKHEAQLLSL